MKKTFILFFFCCTVIFSNAQQLAFPGAEGFGKYAVGGRGGQVVAVTNLQDYKTDETAIEGSFRWALEQHKRTESVYSAQHGANRDITVFEPLTVVFNVSGTIWLKEDIKIKRDSLTIAGQTAPCGGICIAGHSVLFNGATGSESFYYGPYRTDLIVRYIRFRPGKPTDENGQPITAKPADGKMVTYAVDMENYRNVIFDHCSMSWANEECLATYDTKNVTFQWNIISEGLYNAFHPKGNRAYAGVWGGQYATFHHNLIAHQNSRTVRFNGSRAHDTIAVVEYRNNVIYNWGNSDGACGGEIYDPSDGATFYDSLLYKIPLEDRTKADSIKYYRAKPKITQKMISPTGEIYYPVIGKAETNVFNNYYKKGAATSTGDKSKRIMQMYDYYELNFPDKEVGKVYADGNYVYGDATVTANNWNGGIQLKSYPTSLLSNFKQNNISAEVLPFLPQNLETAEEAFEQVLQNCGANLPKRDAIDTRILNETRNGTVTGSGTFGANKGIIDDPTAVGGWVNLTCADGLKVDTDNDGMPDEWEVENGLDPDIAEDRNGINPETGYTWLEEYLNSVVANNGEPSSDCKTKIKELRIYPNPVVNDLNIESEESISQIEIFDLSGRLMQNSIASRNKISIPMQNYSKGVYTIRIKASNGNQSTLKVVK